MDLLRPMREDLAAPSRWTAFEGLRGAAALGVVGYHVLRLLADERAWSDALPRALWWTAGGRLAVDLFFVLSGFLVVQSWSSVRRHEPRLWPAVRTYASKRCLRIFPAYWLSLLVFVPTVAPGLLSVDGLRRLALFVTGQAYWVNGLPDQVNTVYWTLTTELGFYVLAPLVALALRHRLGWPLLAVTVVTSTLWVHGDLQWLRGDLPASHLGGRLDQFVAGAVASTIVLRHEAEGAGSAIARAVGRRGVGWALAIATLGLCQVHGSVLFVGGPATWSVAAFHSVFGLVLAAAVIRVAVRPPTWTSPLWLRGSGQASYSLYLWHYPILVWALSWAGVEHGGYAIGLDGVAALGVAAAVIAAVTYGSYLLAERWIIRRRHR